MKLELTDNDKFLLKLALSVLIAFVFIRLLILPGIFKFQEKMIESGELEKTKTEMQDCMDSMGDVQQSIEENMKELENLSSDYYEKMENRQVDELLTGLALKYDLFPVSLAIEEAVPSDLQAYMQKEEENPAQENTALAAEKYMMKATGSLVLRGDKKNFLSFMDDVEKNCPAVQIRSIGINERAYFEEDWTVGEQSEITCKMAIYMYDQTVVE